MYFILTYCSALRWEFYLPMERHAGDVAALGPNKWGHFQPFAPSSLTPSPTIKYSGSNWSLISLDNHTHNVKAITNKNQTLTKLKRSNTCNSPGGAVGWGCYETMGLGTDSSSPPTRWRMLSPSHSLSSPTVGVTASHVFRCTKAFLK